MNVFIGCSSSSNINQKYQDEAIALATYLTHKNYNLLIGGNDGLMGTITNIFLNQKKKVSIMYVDNYQKIETTIERTFKYKNIATKKQTLITNSNLIIFLPGGLGTLDEIFTAIETKRANEHQNPILIINTNNFYAPLLKQLDNIYNQNFTKEEDKKLYHIANNINDALNYIENIGDHNENK